VRADAARHVKPVEGDITRDRHNTCVHLDDESLGAYVDGELHGWAGQAAADHLRTCSACREAAEVIAALGGAVRRCESPEWDVEAMVAQVEASISRSEAVGMVRASRSRVVESALWGGWAGRAAGWIRSHRRLALGLGIVVIVLAVSVLGIAGAAYRRELTAQDKLLVDSHYMVRSGNVGALLVSYPRR
jgi:hypothetical protein